METNDALAALAALAHPTRLAVFRLLVAAGEDGMAVGRIGQTLGLASATLSFHLKELKHAGMVSVRRESRSLIYGANFAATTGLVAYLTENCCGGNPAACGLPALDGAAKETT